MEQMVDEFVSFLDALGLESDYLTQEEVAELFVYGFVEEA